MDNQAPPQPSTSMPPVQPVSNPPNSPNTPNPPNILDLPTKKFSKWAVVASILAFLVLVCIPVAWVMNNQVKKSAITPTPVPSKSPSPTVESKSPPLENGISYATPSGWKATTFQWGNDEASMCPAITSPDYTSVTEGPSAPNGPKTGIFISICKSSKSSDEGLEKIANDMKLNNPGLTQNEQISLGNVTALHLFGSSEVGFKDTYIVLNGADKWTIAMQFPITTTLSEAKTKRAKYKSQIDQFLQSVKFTQ